MIRFEELKSLFISNPESAIQKSQEAICYSTEFDNYKDFYTYHFQNAHISTCQKEWTNEQMSIHCFECANNPQSHVCLQCFLKGNHKNHDYIILPNSIGNCDCGDLSLWKRSGFCKEHKSEDDSHPENYLDEKLRNILTDLIFSAAFSSIQCLKINEESKIKSILQFLTTFIKLGDGFRRLLSISLIQKNNFQYLIGHIFKTNAEINRCFQKFCSGLITDNLFKINFAGTVYNLMNQEIIPKNLDSLIFKTDNSNYEVWSTFWFHCFSPKPVEYNIIHCNWNWVSFALQYANNMKEYFSMKGLVENDYKMPIYFNEINMSIPIASQMQPNEQTQQLFDDLFTKVLNCGTKDGLKSGINDTIIVASFLEKHEKSYYTAPFLLNNMLYNILHCFHSKENLRFDKLIEELNKSIDISLIYDINEKGNNNNEFISKYFDKKEYQIKNDNNCKSIHNGSPFFFSFPLYDSLLFLFRLDNMCRVKIARFLSLEKYQRLRVQLGIVTLKKLITYACIQQSLVPDTNTSLAILNKNANSNLSGIPMYIPLFQLLIGLQCNENKIIDEFNLKEFFAFEMAKEIGLFDDFTSENYEDEDISDKQIQIVFSALYLPILLVIERDLFNFDGYKFIEEQITLELKKGTSNINELSNAYDPEAEQFTKTKQCFKKILSKVATIDRYSNQSANDESKDSSFYLKEGITCKTISGINLFNNQKVILNNEIEKHPNKLLRIHEFLPEEKSFFISSKDEVINSVGLNMRLKEFLFTPTVLAITYHALRSKEMGIPTVELNDHLAMNILILISKFVKETTQNSESEINEPTTIHYDSTLADLILQLKKEVFHYSIDEKGNATIQNPMYNEKSFNAFLRIKIGSDKFHPKSFIDILLEKGDLGKNSLKNKSIEIDNIGSNSQTSEKEKNQTNKKRANKLKKNILNYYKKEIANYCINNIGLNEEQLSSGNFGEACSICSTSKKNEILCYPIYIYRTKLPFIIDKPPLIKINPLVELSVDDYYGDEPDIDEEEVRQNEEEEEEEEAPNIQKMLSKLNELDDHEEDELQSQIYSFLFDPDLLSHEYHRLKNQQKKILREERLERIALRNEEREKILKLKDPKTGKIEVEKRCTAGNNFVIQFGICQHLIHHGCVDKDAFKCPIERSLKNGFLPAIDILPKEMIFKNFNENKNNVINSDTLSDQVKDAILIFINNFSSFFFSPQADIFVELVKSISSLIATYEIRLRSLPDCLDSKKNEISFTESFFNDMVRLPTSWKTKNAFE